MTSTGRRRMRAQAPAAPSAKPLREPLAPALALARLLAQAHLGLLKALKAGRPWPPHRSLNNSSGPASECTCNSTSSTLSLMNGLMTRLLQTPTSTVLPTTASSMQDGTCQRL